MSVGVDNCSRYVSKKLMLNSVKYGTVKSKKYISCIIDPTAGASTTEEAKWVLDELSLRENVKKVLACFFGPMPVCIVDNSFVPLASPPIVFLKWYILCFCCVHYCNSIIVIVAIIIKQLHS